MMFAPAIAKAQVEKIGKNFAAEIKNFGSITLIFAVIRTTFPVSGGTRI